MRVRVDGADVFISTGGREFDPSGDVILFAHGSGQSHLTFLLQARFLANRGWQVLNPDLPAHGLSGGKPLDRIEDMADWYAALLDATGATSVTCVGHSQGGLSALELAHRHPQRVKKLALISSALAIPVNDALLDMARDNEPAAINAMTDWGHGTEGHFHDHTLPGTSHLAFGRQMMANNQPGALLAGLQACAAYNNGATAAGSVTCPNLCILAAKDKMTPLKQGRKLSAALPNNTCVEIRGAGHMLPSERPFEVTTALREFLTS